MFLSEEKVEELNRAYPKGTKVLLRNMKGEDKMPPGLEGTVKYVDGAGQIHVSWENGSRLALNVEEDSFEKIDPNEELGERLYKKFWCKLEPILQEIDYPRLDNSCNSNDTSYASEVLLKMHNAFEEVYGSEYVDEACSLVLLPAVVQGKQTEKNALALLLIDLHSSGEHWGTTFLSRIGMVTQGNSKLTDEQKQFIREYYGNYDYWYTPLVENDIHVDFENMPEQVVEIRSKVDELLTQRAEAAAMEATKGGQVLLE